jgi:hypothetical protein
MSRDEIVAIAEVYLNGLAKKDRTCRSRETEHFGVVPSGETTG